MEKCQPLTQQDGSSRSSRPESCPSPSQEMNDLVIVKMEGTEYKDIMMENHQLLPTRDVPLKLWCCNLPPHCERGCNSDGEHCITLSLPSIIHGTDLPSNPIALKIPPTESQVTKRFTCPECGKFFVSNSKLLKHQTVHAPKKLFSCPKCGKCFKLKIHVIDHLKTHTGEKTHSCPECGKCFKLKRQVIDHLKTHTGEKPYSCPECGKYFSCQSSLIIHQRIHTKDKPYSCPECEKCFIRKKSLSRHQRRCHKGEKT
ncbi:hypothetical protein GDO78_022606 [Eleutherodactylus coqui]|uniref:C2H2-type domain-containing protein n=1 Tax=Eleutherodactylus coqui TaxID=57060 RepID=A0A8J6JXF0_ELECQ|nr:hypothetical protein GDO78_022606 [Eleutherodactylus coqui]